MDHIKLLVQKLAHAANSGEDNSVLLALVEELRNELTPKSGEAIISSAVSVVLPDGFKAQPKPSESALLNGRPALNPGLSVPRPPSVVVVEAVPLSAQESIKPFETADPEEIVPKPNTEVERTQETAEVSTEVYGGSEELHESAVALPAFETPDYTSAIVIEELPLAQMLNEEQPTADVHVSTLNVELPLTPEMIAEAVAMEMLAINPVEEPEWKNNELAKAPRELNEKVAQRSKMLNEVFTTKEPELVEVLSKPRIVDLRKSISINEKYQFIGSLFRGDEDMFERSIKTLNNFSIMQEAQYWMQRELLIKLGWNEEDELVQRFFELVKRRFN